MREKRKKTPSLLEEFNTTRFLWTFAENWMRVKKAGKLNKYWGDVRSVLEKYDVENPTG